MAWQGAPAEGGAHDFEGGEVNVLRDENDRVDLAVDSSGQGLLVLRDTFREGWSATVGGRDVLIGRVDVLFRAVAVPPGRSLVSFRYDPPGFRLGATFLVLGIVALCSPRKRGIS